MTRTVDVSVIIVNWNTKALVLQCLGSLMERTRDLEVEYIVVDNGSSDGSADAVEAAYPEVRVIRAGKNLGFARANNLGARSARGRYLALVNSDVIDVNGSLAILHRYAQTDPGAGIVGPRLLNVDGSLQQSCRRLPTLWNYLCASFTLYRLMPNVPFLGGEHMVWFGHDRRAEVDVLTGTYLMVRRDAWDELDGFDERFFMYCEETDLCRRMAARGWRVVFFPEAQAIHLGGASSSADPERFYRERYRSRHLYWEKHHGRLSRAGFTAVSLLRHTVKTAANLALWPLRPRTAEVRKARIMANWSTLKFIIQVMGEGTK